VVLLVRNTGFVICSIKAKKLHNEKTSQDVAASLMIPILSLNYVKRIPIKHADLDQAIVKLSRNREGIVMICGECNKSSYKRPMVVSIETRIK